MDLGINGRRAAVAAATSGLGFAVAESLIAEGAHVTICGHDPTLTRSAAEKLGPACKAVIADLTKPAESKRFVHEAESLMGGIDILITNAPGPPPGTFAETSPDAYSDALQLNLLSVVEMCYAAIPSMQRQGWGRVVAITSLAVRQPIPNLILSNTARSGATGFLKTLAREVARDGVTVNSVQPGLHQTERLKSVFGDSLEAELSLIPAGVLGRPEDFAAAVSFLCSDQARYITGTGLALDGGANQSLL